MNLVGWFRDGRHRSILLRYACSWQSVRRSMLSKVQLLLQTFCLSDAVPWRTCYDHQFFLCVVLWRSHHVEQSIQVTILLQCEAARPSRHPLRRVKTLQHKSDVVCKYLSIPTPPNYCDQLHNWVEFKFSLDWVEFMLSLSRSALPRNCGTSSRW